MSKKKEDKPKNSEIESLKKEGKLLLISRIINLRRTIEEQRDYVIKPLEGENDLLRLRVAEKDEQYVALVKKLGDAEQMLLKLQGELTDKLNSLKGEFDELLNQNLEIERKNENLEMGKKLREHDISDLRVEVSRIKIERDLLKEMIAEMIRSN